MIEISLLIVVNLSLEKHNTILQGRWEIEHIRATNGLCIVC